MAKQKQGAKKQDREPERQPEGDVRIDRVDVIELPAPRAAEVPAKSDPAEPDPAEPEMPQHEPRVDHELVVLDALARELDVQLDDVHGDIDLHADLGLAEEHIPQLLSAMGEALDVRFPDDFFDGVTTVAQLTAAVRVSLSPL